jgi:hypothetical protein
MGWMNGLQKMTLCMDSWNKPVIITGYSHGYLLKW